MPAKLMVTLSSYYDFFLFSQNILLDENFNAKVSDFGLAIPRPMQVGSTQVITTITFIPSNRGYLAPEYFEVPVGPYTDIYSYGVVSSLWHAS